jgi:hypothetical protein
MSTDPRFERAPAMPAGIALASLLPAVAGLRNRNAISALLGCAFVGIVVAGVLLALAGGPGFLALLASLVWLLALATGINAAGLLQMDHARGISPRSLADALLHGLMCIPKLIVLGLALLAAAIAVFIVLALLLVICKIPFLGPLLFVVVFPLSVIVAGITVTGLLLCAVLSLPAIWQGAGIARALAQNFAIVRSRLVEALLLLVLLGLICFAVGLIVFAVLMAGLMPTLGLSLSIVGFGGISSEEMLAMAQGYALGGHAVAGLFGGLPVGGRRIAGRPGLSARPVAGLSARHRRARPERVGGGAAGRLRRREAAHRRARRETAPGRAGAVLLRRAVARFRAQRQRALVADHERRRRRHHDARGDPARAAGAHGTDIDLPLDITPRRGNAPAYGAPPAWQPPRAAAPLPGALPPAPPLPAITTCPQCLSSVTPDDVFCGVCGYRLK